jgi:hypothetical protein
MSNAGKVLVNWKRDFPELRIALGLLGKRGYRSERAAAFLLERSETQNVRDFYMRVCGRPMKPDVLVSRMAKFQEIETLRVTHPQAYQRGVVMFNILCPLLDRAIGH